MSFTNKSVRCRGKNIISNHDRKTTLWKDEDPSYSKNLAQSAIPRHALLLGVIGLDGSACPCTLKTVTALSENQNNRNMFIPDMEVHCRHNTYSEIEGHNMDADGTRFFRTVVLTGAIVMWLLIKFEKPTVFCAQWRIFTNQFIENIKPSHRILEIWSARGRVVSAQQLVVHIKEVGSLLCYVLVEIFRHYTLADDKACTSSCSPWQAPELKGSSWIFHCITEHFILFGGTNQAHVYNTHASLLARYMRTPSSEES